MKISVVGSGYVGLVTGACLSDVGHIVTCVDNNNEKIEMLNRGEMPIFEKGLKELVQRNVEDNRLFFTTDIKKSTEEAQVIFIAVGTPPDEDGSADLQYVLAVATDIGNHINGYKVVVDKSTVPIGTADRVKLKISEVLENRKVSYDFDVVSNPEFLKEGVAIDDFMKPDRVVIGTDSGRAKKIMHEVYSAFTFQRDRVIFMGIRSAEMTKYAANAMLATKISFMNEISRLCEEVNADVEDVRTGIGSDRRIGYSFIYPGIGYGGSCFPKDVKALIKIAHKHNSTARILEAVEQVNDEQKLIMVKKIIQHFGDDLTGKIFSLWGLSFKPMTDDMREAPSRVIIKELLKRGAKIQAYDPEAMNESKRIFGDNPNIAYFEDQYSALEDAHALLLLTEWRQFRMPDFDIVNSLLKEKVIFDGRNQYEPIQMKDLGFAYYCIGRP